MFMAYLVPDLLLCLAFFWRENFVPEVGVRTAVLGDQLVSTWPHDIEFSRRLQGLGAKGSSPAQTASVSPGRREVGRIANHGILKPCIHTTYSTPAAARRLVKFSSAGHPGMVPAMVRVPTPVPRQERFEAVRCVKLNLPRRLQLCHGDVRVVAGPLFSLFASRALHRQALVQPLGAQSFILLLRFSTFETSQSPAGLQTSQVFCLSLRASPQQHARQSCGIMFNALHFLSCCWSNPCSLYLYTLPSTSSWRTPLIRSPELISNTKLQDKGA